MAERFGPAQGGEPATVAETHVSVVVFVGDRAYKLKKPVSMGFLDFSTRESREATCHREVELNRRLAPDVYLGVADVLDAGGRPCDHLVVMRRMPPARRLSALVSAGEAVDDEIRRVARVVARFHASARTASEIDEQATRDALRRKWRANFQEMAGVAGTVLPRPDLEHVEQLVERYLDGRDRLLAGRVGAGKARDGHGDLLADDIFCLDDGPRILDCIEFDDTLRYGDVLADVAFLAMDLERLGRPDLAASFLGWYREMSGETYPQSLAGHYVAYRAYIRCKVACLRHEQGDESAGRQAIHLLAMTLDHLERARVRLVLVGGLPGTGKSTLAAGLADATGWVVLRSDEVRKELAGVGHLDRAGAGYRAGLYAPERTQATYRELLGRARVALEGGESVVLDASWADESWRRPAAQLAAATASDLVAVRCECPPEVAAQRLRARRGDASDATPEVAGRMAADAAPWPEAVTVQTAGAEPESLRAGLRAAGVVAVE